MTDIKMEEIHWKDHCSNKYSKWLDYEDLVTEAMKVRSVGYVVFEDDEVVVICHSVNPPDATKEAVQAGVAQMIGDLTILKGGIVSRRVLNGAVKPSRVKSKSRRAS